MNQSTGELSRQLNKYLNRAVVVDTASTVVYLGTLTEVHEGGLWLNNADVHDCRDGHANKEVYVHESCLAGIRTNRRRVFVMRSAVISISALADVVQEDLDGR